MEKFATKVPTEQYWEQQINCQQGCPVHTDARGYVRAIAESRFEEAYLIARGPNPLASICGRVCGAPCESDCRRKHLDQAVSIRALKRFVTDRFESADVATDDPKVLLQRLFDHAAGRQSVLGEELAAMTELLPDELLGDNSEAEPVAIIGSGPAGLAAAHDLALLGLRPTIFEMESVPAGMLAVGIPEYRLPSDLIQSEVKFIENMGVTFKCNTEIGKDISFAEIRAQHQATIVAVGLKRSRKLTIPGSDAKRVFGAVDILRKIALSETVNLRGRVLVVGGGNVAFDIARTVIRQSGLDVSRSALRHPDVLEVVLCSLESLEELPADDVEIMEGEQEGLQRHHRLAPKEILLTDDGYPRAVVFQKCIRVFDEAGKFAPEFDPDDVTTIEADTVIWSVGQQPDVSFFDSAPDITMNDRGLPNYDSETMRTTADDVFLAGDIAHGAKFLIHAVASGKQVARKVFEFIRNVRLVENKSVSHQTIPNYSRELDYEKLERVELPIRSVKQRLSSPLELVELGLSESEAVQEACRCLDCGVNTIFDSASCILCGGCADVCPENCLQLVSLDRLKGGDDLDRVLNDGLPDSNSLIHSAIIKDETICIRCGLCAERCPTKTITMERAFLSSRWTILQATTCDSEKSPL